MGNEVLNFGNIEIEEINKFYHHESPILLDDADFEKVLVSIKILKFLY